MIDNEEIKRVSDTIEIVKNNIKEYEILYSNLLKGNADEQYIQNMSKEYSKKLKNLNKAIDSLKMHVTPTIEEDERSIKNYKEL